MKKLHLIRHAKSSWADTALADIDRPLNKRGLKSCKVMATKIVEAGCGFDHVFCSPAVRARSTIEQLSAALPTTEIDWQIDEALYTFDVWDLRNWCYAIDEALLEVVIVGHNSALTDLINTFGNTPIQNLPTCGYAQLVFGHESEDIAWRSLSARSATLASFLKPKMFMGTSGA